MGRCCSDQRPGQYIIQRDCQQAIQGHSKLKYSCTMNLEPVLLENVNNVIGCGYPVKLDLVRTDDGKHLTQAIQDRVTCYWCKGLAIRPVQCQGCLALYCGQKSTIVCDKCKNKKLRSCLQLANQKIIRDVFYQVNIKCFCRKERFGYTEYLQHLGKCPKKYKFINFQLDGGSAPNPHPIDRWTNRQLNVHLMTSKFTFQIGMNKYDLQKLERERVEVNDHQPNGVALHKEGLSCRVIIHEPGPAWVVELEQNYYSLYSEEIQDIIEQGYNEWKSNTQANNDIRIRIGNSDYKIVRTSFNSFFEQINVLTNYGRPVHRIKL